MSSASVRAVVPGLAAVATWVMAVGVGAGIGVGSYTFVYAKGASYLTDRASACANCHVMQEQFDAWTKSSHHAVAVCNDCHTPHTFLGKWATKVSNGYHHSVAFTTGWFHEPIQATAGNQRVTEQTCRFCHQDIVAAIDTAAPADREMSCIRCHLSVGHLH